MWQDVLWLLLPIWATPLSAFTKDQILPEKIRNVGSGLHSYLQGFQKKHAVLLELLHSPFRRANMSIECKTSFYTLAQRFVELDLNAVKFLDASGKFPAGILEGSQADLGAYDECLSANIPNRFRGQYCSLFMKPTRTAYTDRIYVQLAHMPVIQKRFKNLSSAYRAMGHQKYRGIQLGICVPSTCNRNDLINLFKAATYKLKFDIDVAGCTTGVDGFQELDWVQTVVVTVFGTLLSLIVVATIADVILPWSDYKEKLVPIVKIVKAISIQQTLGHLLVKPSRDNRFIGCLAGIRVLTIWWIVLGHTYAVIEPHILGRSLYLFEMTQNILFCLVSNAYPSVDTFFCLSGFLLSYNLYPQIIHRDLVGTIKTGIRFIINRYIRITIPVLMFVLFLFIYPLLMHGPVADEWIPSKIGNCHRRWWAVLFHINNFLNPEESCSGHLWYVACDMQLFAFSVVLLVATSRNSTIMSAIIILSPAFVCNSYLAWQTYNSNFSPTVVSAGADFQKMVKTSHLVHQRPFAHLTPYVLGVIFGRYMSMHNMKPLSTERRLSIGLLAAILGTYSVFGAYAWQAGQNGEGFWAAFYASLHRGFQATTVLIIIYLCTSNQAPRLQKFLTCHFFVVLSRLTFAVYLVHFLVLLATSAMARERITMHHYFQLKNFFGHLCMSYIFALMFHIVCEQPFINLHQLLTSRSKSLKVSHERKTSDQNNTMEVMESVEKMTNNKSIVKRTSKYEDSTKNKKRDCYIH